MKKKSLFLSVSVLALALTACGTEEENSTDSGNNAEAEEAEAGNDVEEEEAGEENEEENNSGTQEENEAENDHDNENNHNHDHEHEDNHEHDNNHSHDDHDHDNHNHDHDHDHSHDDEDQAIYDGYFEDEQIEDRPLTDWEGEWQSVYPYLQEGELEAVMEQKAEEDETMTAEDYTEYYETGYETDVDEIDIQDGTFTFRTGDSEMEAAYAYDGYEVLTYEAGNRGVRYIFAKEDGDDEMPAFIQFSDHAIFPTDAHHFHLYWGDDREALLDEVTNWPTYYPASMNAEEIREEMLAH
ncbi:metal-binding protein ZinT [Alkalicoccus urumqiensis]|uniref:Metal-binding protein ZinT n=1 Tax=Alkalicoccus urumqiensis TaxID=1548213 RepID=A0A2P6MJI4_ALKUR|nr:metal-binding protein ZinT [Alkalicoccus urumqiensis]PRO66425.1 metal-binding protein ZinT [Alkalicoccus urumqiensis]